MTKITRYDVADATKQRNKAMRYARTNKERAKLAAWDLRPVDYATRIAEFVRDARRWNRIARELRSAVNA